VNPKSCVLLVTLVAVAMTGLVGQASAAKLKGPKRVTPGKNATFRASGFGANKRVIVRLLPTINRGGNGFGIDIKKRFKTNSKGKATLRFKWPRHYNGCSGADGPCEKRKWKAGTRADVFAHNVVGERNYFFARTVVRVRKASATTARVHRCGNVVITPNSGNALSDVRASGISCRAARRKLRGWAKNGYRPTAGPRGYRCRSVGETIPGRVKCKRKGRRRPIISYISGT
jgi:hypothetical protein